MDAALPLEKQKLRQQARTLRGTLPTEALSRLIGEHLSQSAIFQQAEVILAYAAFRGELDILPLAAQFTDKQWFLPRVQPAEASGGASEMMFYAYSPGEDLAPGAYGIPEPSPSAELCSLTTEQCVLILVPGLMFDTHGQRLGYGKGFYDRYLAQAPQRFISCGITCEALIHPGLPTEAWDLPVQWLATESGVRSTT